MNQDLNQALIVPMLGGLRAEEFTEKEVEIQDQEPVLSLQKEVKSCSHLYYLRVVLMQLGLIAG